MVPSVSAGDCLLADMPVRRPYISGPVGRRSERREQRECQRATRTGMGYHLADGPIGITHAQGLAQAGSREAFVAALLRALVGGRVLVASASGGPRGLRDPPL